MSDYVSKIKISLLMDSMKMDSLPVSFSFPAMDFILTMTKNSRTKPFPIWNLLLGS